MKGVLQWYFQALSSELAQSNIASILKTLYTFDTFDSLTGSWSVWPHVVTPQWLIKKIYLLPIYIITLVEKKIIID